VRALSTGEQVIIEDCRLKIEDLRFASLRAVGSRLYEPEAGDSVIKKDDKNERAKRFRPSSIVIR
jgi:hypothetical protein